MAVDPWGITDGYWDSERKWHQTSRATHLRAAGRDGRSVAR